MQPIFAKGNDSKNNLELRIKNFSCLTQKTQQKTQLGALECFKTFQHPRRNKRATDSFLNSSVRKSPCWLLWYHRCSE